MSKNSAYLKTGQQVMMKTWAVYRWYLPGVGFPALGRDGKEYIDFLAGISVNNFGHCHPDITVALAKQAEKILHVSNYFYLEEQIELAQRIDRIDRLSAGFFANSGAEANEAAMKLARKYGKAEIGRQISRLSPPATLFMAGPMGLYPLPVNPNTRRIFSRLCRVSYTPSLTTWSPGKGGHSDRPAPSCWNWSRARAA